jgi:transposase
VAVEVMEGRGSSVGRPSKYTAEYRRDAVALVRNSGEPVKKVARDLGINAETLRNWVNQDKVDRGDGKPGELTSEEKEELRRLRRENAELRIEREILKKAAAFFAKEQDR